MRHLKMTDNLKKNYVKLSTTVSTGRAASKLVKLLCIIEQTKKVMRVYLIEKLRSVEWGWVAHKLEGTEYTMRLSHS